MAKSFKFTLQTVLEVREQATDRAKRDLAVVVQQTTQMKFRLEQRQDYLQKERHKLVASRMSAAEMVAAEDHVRAVTAEVKDLVLRVDELREQESERRQQLAKTMQEQKVLERLREKQQANHLYEVNKQEQELLNELALRRKTYGDDG